MIPSAWIWVWTLTGVAIFRGQVYALEYKNIALADDLSARVRMVNRDGRVSILATVPRRESFRTEITG